MLCTLSSQKSISIPINSSCRRSNFNHLIIDDGNVSEILGNETYSLKMRNLSNPALSITFTEVLGFYILDLEKKSVLFRTKLDFKSLSIRVNDLKGLEA